LRATPSHVRQFTAPVQAFCNDELPPGFISSRANIFPFQLDTRKFLPPVEKTIARNGSFHAVSKKSLIQNTTPQHAAVFSVDEKTAIQALDRKDPVLPLSPGRAERHGFEYFRHGTLSLYAAFNTRTGEVLGKTATRHSSAEFVEFLTELVACQTKAKQIHVIADNLAAHKTESVKQFLANHPHVHMHFTPTYSSWLNQVELWFAKIERDVIARGVFTSVKDLAKKLMRYIRQYNKNPII
jgi:transposase